MILLKKKSDRLLLLGVTVLSILSFGTYFVNFIVNTDKMANKGQLSSAQQLLRLVDEVFSNMPLFSSLFFVLVILVLYAISILVAFFLARFILGWAQRGR